MARISAWTNRQVRNRPSEYNQCTIKWAQCYSTPMGTKKVLSFVGRADGRMQSYDGERLHRPNVLLGFATRVLLVRESSAVELLFVIKDRGFAKIRLNFFLIHVFINYLFMYLVN